MTEYLGYIAMSLDGCIADRDGGTGWLESFHVEGTDFGYADFIAPIDALLMGRRSFDQLSEWGWVYGDRPGYVLTRQPGFTGDHVAAAGDIEGLGAQIRSAGHRHVWVLGGGEAQRAAIDAGLFDRLRVFIMPIVLGGGAPLFAPGRSHRLSLREVQKHPGGVVELDYGFAT